MCGKLKTEAQIGETSLKFCIWVAVLGSLVNPPASFFFLYRSLLALGYLFLGQFFLSFRFSSNKINLGHLCVFSRMYPDFWRVHVRNILLFLWADACCVVRDELPNTVKQMQTTDHSSPCPGVEREPELSLFKIRDWAEWCWNLGHLIASSLFHWGPTSQEVQVHAVTCQSPVTLLV